MTLNLTDGPRERDHLHAARSGPTTRRRAGVDGRAGRVDVVHDADARRDLGARAHASAHVAATLVEGEPTLPRQRTTALEDVDDRQRPDPPELGRKGVARGRRRAATPVPGRRERARGRRPQGAEPRSRRAWRRHARADAAHVPSTHERAPEHARRTRPPSAPRRTRAAFPSTRHSDARATGRANHTARRQAARVSSAIRDMRRTTLVQALHRPHTAPAAPDRAPARTDGTHEGSTPSCRVRVKSARRYVRAATLRRARAGHPARARGRPAS